MTYVWAAYTIIWVVIFGYSLVLGKRQKKIDREIMLLQKQLVEQK